eukprot:TRINITY_DN26666_c0_g1_i3.p1 TRINITY_DN26666_c0_g1~~TRINITY_DN26666_c0_g1_i3.p1  ORF type:complete len:105 (+),score=25.34 TRINITY_DN26666_c0_g1_i3:122-436(+)
MCIRDRLEGYTLPPQLTWEWLRRFVCVRLARPDELFQRQNALARARNYVAVSVEQPLELLLLHVPTIPKTLAQHLQIAQAEGHGLLQIKLLEQTGQLLLCHSPL